MIDEKKLVEELEKMPYIHGRYDHRNANKNFIYGIETWHEMVMNKISDQPKIGEWFPCNIPPERFKDEQQELIPFLVYKKGEKYPFLAFFDGKHWIDGSCHLFFPDGWQPLPGI